MVVVVAKSRRRETHLTDREIEKEAQIEALFVGECKKKIDFLLFFPPPGPFPRCPFSLPVTSAPPPLPSFPFSSDMVTLEKWRQSEKSSYGLPQDRLMCGLPLTGIEPWQEALSWLLIPVEWFLCDQFTWCLVTFCCGHFLGRFFFRLWPVFSAMREGGGKWSFRCGRRAFVASGRRFCKSSTIHQFKVGFRCLTVWENWWGGGGGGLGQAIESLRPFYRNPYHSVSSSVGWRFCLKLLLLSIILALGHLHTSPFPSLPPPPPPRRLLFSPSLSSILELIFAGWLHQKLL